MGGGRFGASARGRIITIPDNGKVRYKDQDGFDVFTIDHKGNINRKGNIGRT